GNTPSADSEVELEPRLRGHALPGPYDWHIFLAPARRSSDTAGSRIYTCAPPSRVRSQYSCAECRRLMAADTNRKRLASQSHAPRAHSQHRGQSFSNIQSPAPKPHPYRPNI